MNNKVNIIYIFTQCISCFNFGITNKTGAGGWRNNVKLICDSQSSLYLLLQLFFVGQESQSQNDKQNCGFFNKKLSHHDYVTSIF